MNTSFKYLPKFIYFSLIGAPFLFILMQLPYNLKLSWLPDEIWQVLTNLFMQIVVTLCFSWIVGLLLFFGILSLKAKIQHIDFLVLLPFLMPSLLLISIYFSWFTFLPLGNFSVGWIQGFALGGLFAFTLSRFYYQKWIVLEETSFLLGIRSRQYWYIVLLASKKVIAQLNLTGLFFVVTSFSIPFMVGGVRGQNLEVLIYEKIRMSQNISEAMLLGLIQIIILLTVNYYFRLQLRLPEYKVKSNGSNSNSRYVSQFWILAPMVYLLFFLKPLFEGLRWGVPRLIKQLASSHDMQVAIFNSAWLYLGSILISFLLILLIGYLFLKLDSDHYPFIWIAPTPTLVIIALWPMAKLNQMIAIAFAFLFLFIPSIVKLMLPQLLAVLRPQIRIARLLGASEGQIFLKIYYPQVNSLVAFLSTIFGFWCLLDFSITQLIMEQSHLYLGPLIQSWLASYRYYEAMGLLLISILWGTLGIGWTYAKLNLYQRS